MFMYGEANVTADGQPLTKEMRQKSVAIPFIYTGVAQAIVPVLTILLYFTHRYKSPTPRATVNMTEKDTKTKEIESKGDLEKVPKLDSAKAPETKIVIRHRIAKLILSSFMLAMYNATELGYMPYNSTLWQELDIRMTVYESGRVASVHSIAYTLSPLINTFLSLRFQPDTIMSTLLAFLVAGITTLFFGRHNAILIYVGNIFLGYGMGASMPTLYACINRHLGITGKVASFLSFTTGLCSLVVPMLLSQYLDTQPLILLYLLMFFIFASLTSFVLLKLWIFITQASKSSDNK